MRTKKKAVKKFHFAADEIEIKDVKTYNERMLSLLDKYSRAKEYKIKTWQKVGQ